MDRRISLAIAVIYLLTVLIAISITAYEMIANSLGSLDDLKLLFSCVLIGGVGGVLYCLRGVYLNYAVKDQWDDKWLIWYLIRPIVSLICGAVSYVFLKAGLLVLEAQKETNASNLGFYALSFIAGMNVDKFIEKIEDLAQATWGIAKSRSTDDKNN